VFESHKAAVAASCFATTKLGLHLRNFSPSCPCASCDRVGTQACQFLFVGYGSCTSTPSASLKRGHVCLCLHSLHRGQGLGRQTHRHTLPSEWQTVPGFQHGYHPIHIHDVYTLVWLDCSAPTISHLESLSHFRSPWQSCAFFST
jgi:hypothetical protein